ncbi:nucleoporin SEH1 [Trypanosoma theileri]|uniref:Nucleoporin SEH1 n=1 Tax=Trypanosoma theileri TaxID=67003 RepID=A0A1X0NW55_9TRYP|nr:nucleoporin SEH1 [Trypanosoma theileri]ORC88439.1 nucleoporin SEH1 [Trypanosoma theileri]
MVLCEGVNMYPCKTAHRTFVHHMALDPSGALLASCSSDKVVNIFHRTLLDTESNDWSLCCVLNDHVATVTRVAWCLHREHEALLATAGADRWIYVYKIEIVIHDGKPVVQAERCSTVRGYETDVITDVAFIRPQQRYGLRLSTASLDGWVRLYEVQQKQLLSISKITQETEVGRPLETRSGAITSIAWFPSSADEAMTLAVGCMNGCFYLYRVSNEYKHFERIRSAPFERANASIHHIVWGPSVGRPFQLLAICCRSCVYILRLNCVSPALEDFDCELFKWPQGAVCAAWSRSAVLLYLVSDDEGTEMTVLRTRDPSDHQSWEEVSENFP